MANRKKLKREKISSGARTSARVFLAVLFAWLGLSVTAATPGIAYIHDEVKEVPWSIHIVKLSRTNSDYEIHTALGAGSRIGAAPLSQQLELLPQDWGQPVAAVNGDYFVREGNYLGDPEGLQIRNGELVSAPSAKSCFWLDGSRLPNITNVVSQLNVVWPDSVVTSIGLNEELGERPAVLYTPAIQSTHTTAGIELILESAMTETPLLPFRPGHSYTARIREVRKSGNTAMNSQSLVLAINPAKMPRVPVYNIGDVVQIHTTTSPNLQGVRTAISGGPALLRNGVLAKFSSEAVRHPRTALGWNLESFFLVEVDGRQRNLSAGMTLSELAEYMRRLGCTEALNLDGGGSATLWCYGRVMNSPCDGSERETGNALVITRRSK